MIRVELNSTRAFTVTHGFIWFGSVRGFLSDWFLSPGDACVIVYKHYFAHNVLQDGKISGLLVLVLLFVFGVGVGFGFGFDFSIVHSLNTDSLSDLVKLLLSMLANLTLSSYQQETCVLCLITGKPLKHIQLQFPKSPPTPPL